MQQEGRFQIPKVILVSAFMLSFAMTAPMFSVPPMEHILKEELLLTHTQTSLLFTVPIIMLIALAIPGGLLADKIGIRKTAGIGAITIAVGSMLRGTATDFSSLIAFTFIYGLGFSLVFPTLPKLVGAWAPREKAGIATGVFSAGMYVGAALALAITIPILLPITNTFQGTFYIWGIPAIVAAILCWTFVREPRIDSAQVETVSQKSIPFRQVLKNKSLWLVAILFLIHHFFTYTWAGWAPALLMQKGATPGLASLIASVVMWVGIPSIFLAPRLSYRLGLRKPFIWIPSFILACASLGAIYMTVPMGWPLMALVGIAHGTRFVTIMALPVEMMPKEVVGMASGLVLSVSYIGGIIGPLIGGHILDVTGNLNLSLLVLVGLSIGAGVLALRIPETGPKGSLQK